VDVVVRVPPGQNSASSAMPELLLEENSGLTIDASWEVAYWGDGGIVAGVADNADE
jgi:hypothetical protein